MKPFYFMGRFLQVVGLLALPSAIWVTEWVKSEAQALAIFFGSVGVFFAGWLLTKIE